MGIRLSYSPYSRPRCLLSCWGNRTGFGVIGMEDCSWWGKSWHYKPSFNWYFRSFWSGKKLSYPIFDNGFQTVTQYKKIRLRAGKNDPTNPFIKDEWVRRLFAATQPGSTGVTTALVVNGMIRAYYNPIARLDALFYQEWFCTPLGFDVAKIGVWEDGDPGVYKQWLGNTSGSYNPAAAQSFDIIEQFVDVENWADYILVLMFGCTSDWPTNNFVYYRGKTSGQLGKFKFGVWDAEFFSLGVTGCWDARFPATAQTAIQGFFNRMRGNPEVEQIFQDRAYKLVVSPDGSLTEQFVRKTYLDLQGPTTELARWVMDDPRFSITTSPLSPLASRAAGFLTELQGEGYWQSSVTAPDFSQLGGVVPSNASVTLSSSQSQVVNYCHGFISTTGAFLDPRLKYGVVNPAPECQQSNGPVTFNFTQNTVVAARVKNGGRWSPLHRRQFEIEQTISALRVSELLYDDDSDSTEFIELTNIGSTPIDVGGWQLWAGVYLFLAYGTVIQPGEYVCIVEDDNSFIKDYGTSSCRVLGVFQYLGTLKNEGERVAMRTSDGRSVFDFQYDTEVPWPRKAAGLGYSLVWAGDVTLAPGDYRYWRDSTDRYGSPGRADPAPQAPAPVLSNSVVPQSSRPSPCEDAAIRPCSTVGGNGTQICIAGAWGRCIETVCKPGYTFVNDVCTLFECQAGATRSCTLASGHGSGQQQCNASYTWSRCYPATCNSGHHPEGLACVAGNCSAGQTQRCELPTGAGLLNCTGGTWPQACRCRTCNASFVCVTGQCEFVECSSSETRPCLIGSVPGQETCSGGRFVDCTAVPHLCPCMDASECGSNDRCAWSTCQATYCCTSSAECPTAAPLCRGGRCQSGDDDGTETQPTGSQPNPASCQRLFFP